ncbi:predicted protein [Thalassiosira pseudonana CCMP1335]|uniref:Uncharacterized protein n=1 Tax=Thalassiosira pseudonana TaxID=35128 RepID=B8BZA8_THAPS|nr:predicted protein [Thalassiosira pseudonana CCMP1335]EED92850.1 predicted protein [Thalassiosira pseudonana CCMP1335]
MFTSLLLFFASYLTILLAATIVLSAIWSESTKKTQHDVGAKVDIVPRRYEDADSGGYDDASPRQTEIDSIPNQEDEEDLVGGSPLLLPPIKGPTSTSITFHVYAPPSLDKEIPKVDLVGAVQFVKTGNVRTFFHTGAKRLLVVNFLDFTLEEYMQKQGKEGKKKVRRGQRKLIQNEQASLSRTSDSGLFSDDASRMTKSQRNMKRHLSGGINISTKILMKNDDDDSEDEMNEDEDDWNRQYFESSPVTTLKLNELVSVSALAPRHGGVLEISSRVATSTQKNRPLGVAQSSPVPNTRSSKRPSSITETLHNVNIHESLPDFVHNFQDDDGRLEYAEPSVSVGDEIKDLVSESPVDSTGVNASSNTVLVLNATHGETTTLAEERRDEYAFYSPLDAAEFQRIVLSLRTAGREISHLYESLEEVQANSDAYYPQEMLPDESDTKTKPKKSKKDGNDSCYRIPRFVSPGVALDDAWRCMNEIHPVLREGLRQFHEHSSFHRSHGDDLIAAAASYDERKQSSKDEVGNGSNESEQDVVLRKELARHYGERRATLGIVDFFLLFVPPLPKDSAAFAYCAPCAATEDTLNDGIDADSFSGLELHYQQLRIAVALQARVRKAALYVSSYYKAKKVVHAGWHLNGKKQETAASSDEVEVNVSEEQPIKDFTPNIQFTRLAYDYDRENWVHDLKAENECYEATVGRDVTVVTSKANDARYLAESGYQGYALVGWHAFQLPLSDDTSDDKFWLHPDKDPLLCIPSLRKVVEQNSDSHFFVTSHFNKHVRVAAYFLFVRSLPVGADDAFDSSINTFVNGSSKSRNQRFEVSFQLGSGQNWTSVTKMMVQSLVVVLCHGWVRGQVKLPFRNRERRERISFPGLLATNMASVKHFGGALQTNALLPTNYVAATMDIGDHSAKSILGRLLLRCLNINALKTCIFDLAYVVKTLPEDGIANTRALATCRMVHLDGKIVCKPTDFREEEHELAAADSIVKGRTGRTDQVVTAGNIWKRMLRFGTNEKKRYPLNHTCPSRTHADELYTNEIDAVYEILDGVKVPTRNDDMEKTDELVRLRLSRSDLERFIIACDCDIREAAVRVVESCAWRGMTFPIDVSSCRVELQSGQFFQQGFDKANNPIFYFRNRLVGPWRGDVDATIFSILHRLESYLNKVAVTRQGVKITLIAILGSPIDEEKRKVDNGNEQSTEQSPENRMDTLAIGTVDPMIDPSDQHYSTHSSSELFLRLRDILSRNYPERLAKCLIFGGASTKLKLREYIPSQVDVPR